MSARIIVGVKLSHLIHIKDHRESVLRFNEVTGAPYYRDQSKLTFFWLGQEISEEDLLKKIEGLRARGAFFSTARPYSQAQIEGEIAGVQVVGVDAGEHVEVVASETSGCQKKLRELIPGIPEKITYFLYLDERWWD